MSGAYGCGWRVSVLLDYLGDGEGVAGGGDVGADVLRDLDSR